MNLCKNNFFSEILDNCKDKIYEALDREEVIVEFF